MNWTDEMRTSYGSRLESLANAYAMDDEQAFMRELDDLLKLRERGLFLEIGKLTRDLNSALERFTFDARIVDLAEKDVPDARQRLEHVLKLTDEAAHQTLDLVERSCPLAERTGRAAQEIAPLWSAFRARRIAVVDFQDMLERLDRFLVAARSDSDTVKRNLNEVLVAQGYQDLTGQIIRSVMQLVGEVEHALGDLLRLSHAERNGSVRTARNGLRESANAEAGVGPVVPGVAHGAVAAGQQDVDALLSGLGL